MYHLTKKEAYVVYYTEIKRDGHLRTQGKCRKHEPQASAPGLHCDKTQRTFENTRKMQKT